MRFKKASLTMISDKDGDHPAIKIQFGDPLTDNEITIMKSSILEWILDFFDFQNIHAYRMQVLLDISRIAVSANRYSINLIG